MSMQAGNTGFRRTGRRGEAPEPDDRERREMDGEITRARIAAAEKLIRPHIRRTPVIAVDGADFGLDVASICFKLELMQHSGSFKVRGAFANLLMREVPPVGVAAASGGSHGVAVAYAARRLGVPARIFVPSIASPAKIARIRDYRAELVVVGALYADALAASEIFVAQSGALAVHAFDQAETLLGQGTLALELEGQVRDLDTLLVPVGGGGLIGGIAAWFGRKVRVVAVEPEASPTLYRARAAGRPVDAEAGGIAAESLAPRRIGELGFAIARDCVDRVVLIDDDAIRAAQRALWDAIRVVAEPGGAAALAALLARRYRPEKSERVGVVVSGGNTIAVDFER